MEGYASQDRSLLALPEAGVGPLNGPVQIGEVPSSFLWFVSPNAFGYIPPWKSSA